MAKFCQPKAKVGLQHGWHCRMPTLIQKAAAHIAEEVTCICIIAKV